MCHLLVAGTILPAINARRNEPSMHSFFFVCCIICQLFFLLCVICLYLSVIHLCLHVVPVLCCVTGTSATATPREEGKFVCFLYLFYLWITYFCFVCLSFFFVSAMCCLCHAFTCLLPCTCLFHAGQNVHTCVSEVLQSSALDVVYGCGGSFRQPRVLLLLCMRGLVHESQSRAERVLGALPHAQRLQRISAGLMGGVGPAFNASSNVTCRGSGTYSCPCPCPCPCGSGCCCSSAGSWWCVCRGCCCACDSTRRRLLTRLWAPALG